MIPEGVKFIPLSQGKMAIVDAENYDYLMQWKWHINSKGYAVRNIYIGKVNGKSKFECICLHRLIMKTPKGMDTDHINRNRLDDRKNNLRICTREGNTRNVGARKGTSIYKGVHWCKRAKKWVAQIRAHNKENHLGYFESEKEASIAYNKAALKYHGEFACLNEIVA